LLFKFKVCWEIAVFGKPSLAEEQAGLTIGIILLGMDSEGITGIQPIKGELEMVTLQDSTGAK
jgi:chemotaxis response regulator CheB